MPPNLSNNDVPACIDCSVYPLARKDESVVDDFHGNKIKDPYRWLENPDFDETKVFIKKLNAVSEKFIASSPIREKLRKRLTELWDYEKYSCTSRRGNYYFYFYNSGLQNQSVLYKQKSLSEKGEVFLDPNLLSSDGTTAIRQSCFTTDGSIFAYGLSEKGSDWVTLKFRTAEGKDLEDVVTGVKHSDLAWTSDNSGVFYSKYPTYKAAKEGSSTEEHEFHSLYFHKMGTSETEDVLVADFRSNPHNMCSGSVSQDGRLLIVNVNKGCDPKNMLFYFDLTTCDNKITGKLELKPLFTKFDAKYDFIDFDGDSVLVKTNHSAPMFKLIRMNINKPDAESSTWKTVIAEDARNTLDWVAPVASNFMIVAYLEDVKTALYVHCLKTGKLLYKIPLEMGSVTGFFGKKRLTEIFLSYESFFTPMIIYRGDFAGLSLENPVKLKELRRVSIKGIDTKQLVAKQVFVDSKDGTKVPMFILHGPDLVLNGNNSTILSGYGGFNVADIPYFSVTRLLLIHNFRGVVACANLRGGSEYGERWHEAGMRENKQNVFDDFIAAAEYLIANNYTSPSKLAISGGSNGGLLVGACSRQRPELYGAVINRVGVLDMLRFHKFTIGGSWIPEYGNPDEASDFSFIYKYSPLHNIEIPVNGHQWPSTMLLTGDHDDRVVPSHSLKYIATLYENIHAAKDFQKKPIIIRVDVRAGHGSGKPTNKLISEIVDIYSFCHLVLDMKWHD